MLSFLDSDDVDLNATARAQMIRHTLVALACVPLYIVAPALFGLAVAPYVIWMVFRGRPEMLVPLMIHMLHGSQQRYIILASCFIYSIAHIEVLFRRKLGGVFFLYLCSLPFFIWYTIERYRTFGGGIGAGGTFEGIGYYFGISTFFWGMLAIGRLPAYVAKGMLWLCFGVVILHFAFFMVLPFTRFLFWGLPFLTVFAFWLWLQKRNRKFAKLQWLGIVTGVIMIVGFMGFSSMRITFTLLGTVAVGMLVLVVAKYFRGMFWLLKPIVVLPLLTLWMFFTINRWEKEGKGYVDNTAYSDIKVRDWDSFKYKLFRKTMTDRAPVWYASWDAVRKQFDRDPVWVDVMPIYGSIDLEGDLYRGGREVTVALAAHNMLLEMLRLYGAWGGLGIYLVFLIVSSLGIIKTRLALDIATPCAPILACCVAHVIVGGQTGQYPITPQFSFYLFGLMGVCVGKTVNK